MSPSTRSLRAELHIHKHVFHGRPRAGSRYSSHRDEAWSKTGADADDIVILLCAINGNATHLVTYDAGFEPFGGEFGFAVCEPLEFLRELRAAKAS